ncbi:hypothetical protein Tco_0555094, partial [Tanacetum coccineum]
GKGKIDDKGKGKVDEKGNAKQVEDDVDLIDALDLQNRIKKLSEDFNRLLKAKKEKEAKEAELVGKYKSEGQSTAKLKVKVLPA